MPSFHIRAGWAAAQLVVTRPRGGSRRGGLLFLLQWGMSRAANRWYLLGYVAIVLGPLVSVTVGSTTVWNQMVGSFVA
jgi:hypothetical protein